MENRIVRCQAAILDETMGKVLLIQHQNKYGKHYWWLPGGGLEKDENPEKCIRREIREELQMSINIKNSFTMENILERTYRKYITFICTLNETINDIKYESTDDCRIVQAKWFDIHARENMEGIFRDKDLSPFIDEIVRKLSLELRKKEEAN